MSNLFSLCVGKKLYVDTFSEMILIFCIAWLFIAWWITASFCSGNGCKLYKAYRGQTFLADTWWGSYISVYILKLACNREVLQIKLALQNVVNWKLHGHPQLTRGPGLTYLPSLWTPNPTCYPHFLYVVPPFCVLSVLVVWVLVLSCADVI